MTLSSIQSKIYFLTKTNSSSFVNSDMIIFINNAIEHVSSLVMANDARWQWDDTNQTDFPIATTNLVSGQQDYPLATAHLTIDRVEVQDSANNWHRVSQIDQQDLKRGFAGSIGGSQSLTDYQKVNGAPNEYDLVGLSLFLYPAPNYSLTGGLKLYYTRAPVLFAVSDLSTGTATPGFASIFHDLVPLWVAYDYSVANTQPTANGFFAQIQIKEKQLVDFYGLRDRDRRGRFTVSTNNMIGSESGRIGFGLGDSNK